MQFLNVCHCFCFMVIENRNRVVLVLIHYLFVLLPSQSIPNDLQPNLQLYHFRFLDTNFYPKLLSLIQYNLFPCQILCCPKIRNFLFHRFVFRNRKKIQFLFDSLNKIKNEFMFDNPHQQIKLLGKKDIYFLCFKYWKNFQT